MSFIFADDWTEADYLNGRIETLENAIRKHRDQKGDDRCWMDDEELYKVLPEGYTPPQRDSCVQLELCKKYIECRQNPKTEYVSPQRRIEELEKELQELRLDKLNLMEHSRKLMGILTKVTSTLKDGVDEVYNEICKI